MLRMIVPALVLTASAAFAQAPDSAPAAPATIPVSFAARPPATRPSPDQLLAQAYEQMRQERFDRATPLLNRAYERTPQEARRRALVLNRALLDLVQKTNALRGVRELHAYMARETAPDEQASNLLGSLLDLVAQNPRWRDGPIYADAFREFARRESALERERPGFKRWGAKWITQEEYDRIKQRDRELEEEIAQHGRAIERLNVTARSLNEQYANAEKQLKGLGFHGHRRGIYDPQVDTSACAQCRAMHEAQASLTEVGAEMNALAAELKRETKRYQDLQKRVTRPTWPRRYDPIDPSAPPPAPLRDPGTEAQAGAEVPVNPATLPAAPVEQNGVSP
jgi:hypothetical protein